MDKFSEVEYASALILDDDNNEILLLKKRHLPVWYLPKFKKIHKVSLEESLKFRVKTDIGYNVEIKEKKMIYYQKNFLKNKNRVTTYICRIRGGRPVVSNDISQISFCKISVLPYNFSTLDREMLFDALSNNSFHIKTQKNYFLKKIWDVARSGNARWLIKYLIGD